MRGKKTGLICIVHDYNYCMNPMMNLWDYNFELYHVSCYEGDDYAFLIVHLLNFTALLVGCVWVLVAFQLIFPHFLFFWDRFPNVILPIRNMLMEESRQGCNRAYRIGGGKCNNLKTHNSQQPNLNFVGRGICRLNICGGFGECADDWYGEKSPWIL